MCGSIAGRRSRYLRFSFFSLVVRRSANSRTLWGMRGLVPPGRMRGSTAGETPFLFGKQFAWSARALPFSLSSKKGGEGSGRGGRFLSVSPLSSSLPARSSRGEREKRPRRFSCRTQHYWRDARRYAVKHLRRCLIAPYPRRAGDRPPCPVPTVREGARSRELV